MVNRPADGVRNRVSFVKNRVVVSIERSSGPWTLAWQAPPTGSAFPRDRPPPALSATLDELSALLEHVALTQ
ncbi:hypothetical protein RU08_03200 [Pseudomonas fulva]|uniref:Uncharacterized protein n=1 Tax=Pseudomonas fulva TaxID=47880 RepID=A0A0D0K9A2_9PSED|nr:hypothetical protein RU08_03200 [Pseudomonas fulva]